MEVSKCYLVKEMLSEAVYIGECVDAGKVISHVYVLCVSAGPTMRFAVRHVCAYVDFAAPVKIEGKHWVIDNEKSHHNGVPVVELKQAGRGDLTEAGKKLLEV